MLYNRAMSTRNIVGRCVGIAGAVAVMGGIFFKWAQGTTGLKTPITRLISAQVESAPHQVTHSMGLVFAGWSLLLLVCAAFGRRMLTFFLGFCTLATVGLWAGMMFLYEEPRSFGPHNFQLGAWIVIGGAILAIIGSRIIPKKHRE